MLILYPYGNNKVVATLLQLCKILTQGYHKVVAICARCLQPYRVVATLHDGYEVVVEIVKFCFTSKNYSYLKGYKKKT